MTSMKVPAEGGREAGKKSHAIQAGMRKEKSHNKSVCACGCFPRCFDRRRSVFDGYSTRKRAVGFLLKQKEAMAYAMIAHAMAKIESKRS